jgi:hypothetical protein
MNAIGRVMLRVALALSLTAASGCDQMGGLGNPPGSIYGPGDRDQTELEDEVQRVDTRSRQIEVRTQDGRTRRVGYTSATQVIYRQQDYSVDNLEPGDVVSMRVEQDRYGSYSTDLIRVRQPVQERGGIVSPGSRVERLEGEVGRIDYQRGSFELRDRSSGNVVVSLPYNPPGSVVDRFQQLRRGDYVTVEGRFLNQDRFELEAFSRTERSR